jgi:hypothetical protein
MDRKTPMRPTDRTEAARLEAALETYQSAHGPLPGLSSEERSGSLIQQILASERRGRYFREVMRVRVGEARIDPDSGMFDPLKAVVLRQQDGSRDEAIWLLFLFVHFGRNRHGGWRYAADVYRGHGPGARWDWAHTSTDVPGFCLWIKTQAAGIRAAGPGGFGNHRKYERLEDTGEVVASYVDWAVGGTQSGRIETEVALADGDPRRAFGRLYRSMGRIHRFGRTARFDYLSALARLSLAPIIADRAYLEEATGPARGAALLFRGSKDAREHPVALDGMVVHLDTYLELGMDTLEDALCNWQKSPDQFRPFRG